MHQEIKQGEGVSKRSLMSILCCVFDSEEEDEQARLQQGNSLQRYQQSKLDEKKEKTELVLLGNVLPEGMYSLVRITQKNFFVDFNQKKAQMQQKKMSKLQKVHPSTIQTDTNLANIMYSLYEYGIVVKKNELDQAIPEKVLKYIAKRCFNLGQQIVVNANCGSGALAIQIACEDTCDVVIAVDNDRDSLNNTITNARIYRVDEKIQGLYCEHQQIKLARKPDVIVLCPKIPKSSQSFSLIKGAQEIEALITKSFQICQNMIVVLQGKLDVSEITAIFSYILQKENSQIFKFEIQYVQIDGILTNYIVYVGDVSQTDKQDEYEFATLFLLADSQAYDTYEQLYNFLKRIGTSCHFRDIMKSLVRSAEKAKRQSESILQAFIYDIQYHQLIEQKFVEQFIENMSDDIIIQYTPQMNKQYLSSATFNPDDSRSEGKMRFESVTSNYHQSHYRSRGLNQQSFAQFNEGQDEDSHEVEQTHCILFDQLQEK